MLSIGSGCSGSWIVDPMLIESLNGRAGVDVLYREPSALFERAAPGSDGPVGAQHDELVASEASDDVGAAERRAEHRSRSADRAVSGVVPQLVVDCLSPSRSAKKNEAFCRPRRTRDSSCSARTLNPGDCASRSARPRRPSHAAPRPSRPVCEACLSRAPKAKLSALYTAEHGWCDLSGSWTP